MTLSAMSPQNRLIDSVAVTVQLPDLQENLTPMRSKMQSTQTSRIKGGARLRRSHARLVQAGLLTLSLLAGSLGLAAPLPPLQLPPARHSADKRAAVCSLAQTVARNWNEQTLAAIRLDAPRPTVHARNLFHVSLAMYEAWAAYAPEASAWRFDESAAAFGQPQSNREIAISHAAYRVLVNRFSGSPGASSSLASFAACMQALGQDPANTGTTGNSPQAIGNRIGAAIIAFGLQDHSNQQNSYLDTTFYFPVNSPMLVQLPGTGGLVDINAWQPLIPPGAPGVQNFLTPHWSLVTPFALVRPAPNATYLDPGPQPKLGGIGDAQLRQDVLSLIRFSGRLDPDDGVQINISPRLVGNSTLGSNNGQGHPLNPATGQPYADNFVLRGDWGRVLSEFWADGPLSSTPPGHWNEIANEVSDHPATVKRIGGNGPVLSDLDWDIKLYLTLNGALHDTAIATWEVKRKYDSARPITLIREMGSLGQSSNPALPSYHVNGLPLEDGLVELITTASSAPGQRHAHLAGHVGEIAIHAWLGHPADPLTQHGGVGWIRAVDWIPYQKRSFVTPPFAGYTSGHSGFSRAGAEVLTAFTGTPYFPGGLGEFVADAGGNGRFHLAFEYGPAQTTRLQWATYYDASDEAGISRIYGGIHPAYDDFPGRVIGHEAGLAALASALPLFGTPPPDALPVPAIDALARLVLLLGVLTLAGVWLRRR